MYDGTSDFGRIDRQDAFLRAMVDAAKKLYNPFTLNAFLTKLPKGVTLDSTSRSNELIGLAERFHGLNANSIQTYTLPTTAVNNTAARRRALRRAALRPAAAGQHLRQ